MALTVTDQYGHALTHVGLEKGVMLPCGDNSRGILAVED
jgi:hypothetical protein